MQSVQNYVRGIHYRRCASCAKADLLTERREKAAAAAAAAASANGKKKKKKKKKSPHSESSLGAAGPADQDGRQDGAIGRAAVVGSWVRDLLSNLSSCKVFWQHGPDTLTNKNEPDAKVNEHEC